MKKILVLALIAVVSVVFAACDLMAPSKPNVYVCITNGKHSDRGWERNCKLTFVTYVYDGSDARGGANILGKQKGTLQFNGDTYQCFCVPRGVWDFYIEWSSDYSVMENARYTINTRANDWVRISWDLANEHDVEPGLRQGTGTMY